MKPTFSILGIKHIHKEGEIINVLMTMTHKTKKQIKFILKYTTLPLLIFKPLNENEISYLNENCICIKH